MDWQQKLTAFYNLTMHSLDKTVEPLTHKKGQIQKLEQGKLKMPMLIDRSVSAGLLCKNNTNISVSGANI